MKVWWGILDCGRMLVIACTLVLCTLFTPLQASADQVPILHITGLKASSTSEYVEIYNDDIQPIDVTGWKIEYSNVSGSNIRILALPSGIIQPDTELLYASPNFITTYLSSYVGSYLPLLYSGLADSGGFVRLYAPTADTANYPEGFIKVDEIGWLSSSDGSLSPATVHYTGAKSIYRCVDLIGDFVDRGDNRIDFVVLDEPNISDTRPVCVDLIVPEEEVEPVLNTCEGIRISEVLPNPVGSDAGNEFIEIQNTSNSIVAIGGCRIELGSGQSYVLESALEVGAGEFLGFSDTTLGFTFLNSQAQTIYFIGGDNAEVHQTNYPADLDDNQSWALFDDTFTSTYTPTNGLQNIHTPLKPCDEGYERNSETGRCNQISQQEAEESVTTCDSGYERNPETNRCRKIVSTVLSPCPSGQTRNPQTNRCRSDAVTTVLSSCAVGQERNPETNRCRKIDTGTELMPCDVGEERNPETNRCRTIIENAVIETTKLEVADATPASSTLPIPVGMVGAGVVGYAVYEWKKELKSLSSRMGSRFKKK